MPLTFLSPKGLKGSDPGQMLGEPSAEEFSARRRPGCSCEGLTALPVEPGSGETPGTVPASEIN